MKAVLSREQSRALDRHATDVCHVPSLLLMENAGRGAADVVLDRLGAAPGPVAVVCGAGNNGGDGFVVARQLLSRGKDVRVLFASRRDRLKGDALVNHDAWVATGGLVILIEEATLPDLERELGRAVLVVDALLGTGLERTVKGFFGTVIERVNGARGHRIALDLPSGLDADTGTPLGIAVRADETVTFAHLKLGLLGSIGAEHAGRVTIAGLGIPASVSAAVGQSARLLEEEDVRSWLVPRPLATHKGSAGRVVAVAGSAGKTGAALLVARGALRAGAGLVSLSTFPDVADAIDLRVLEEMTARIDRGRIEASLDAELASADAVVVGPGIGHDAGAQAAIEHVVLRHPGLVVVDADALTHFAGRLAELRGARGRLILTPHPGEMARLLSVTTAEVEEDRFGAVARAANAAGATVLLKGARTLISAPGELTVVNPSGSPALATAGSGDVLSGVTAAMVATLGDPFRAACAAAFIHGRSTENWARLHDGADRGLLAHEIADGIPVVIAALTRTRPAMPV